MSKLENPGTTPDGTTGQTQEIMPGVVDAAVPTPASAVQMARDSRVPTLSDERKREIEAESKRKITFMEREYWRMRNFEQDFMRCPFCPTVSTVTGDKQFRHNHMDQPMCCPLFAKAFAAILDRQKEVDTAASHVRNLHRVGLVN